MNNGISCESLFNVFFIPGPSTKKRQDIVGESDELHCQPHSVDPAGNVADNKIIELEGEDMSVEGCDSYKRNPMSESATVGEVECFGQNSDVNCEMSGEHRIQKTGVEGLLQSGSSLVTKESELGKKCLNKEAVSSHRHKRKRHRHSRKRSHSKPRGGMFEGERVSYLVGQCEAEEAHPADEHGEQSSVQEDDYVLRKLFKHSGESCVKYIDLYWFLILMLFVLHSVPCVKLRTPVKTHSGVCHCMNCCPGFIVLPCLFLNTEELKQLKLCQVSFLMNCL
jgi:hypothetical protein